MGHFYKPFHVEHNIFNNEEIDRIIEDHSPNVFDAGVLMKDGSSSIEKKSRNSHITWISRINDNNTWIFDRLDALWRKVNDEFFHYDLTQLKHLQYTEYGSEQFFKPHVDMSYGFVGEQVRKLSMSIQLSGADDYEDGSMFVYPTDTQHGEVFTRKKGSGIFFPSNMIHEVKPVTEGVRRSLVGWIIGPPVR